MWNVSIDISNISGLRFQYELADTYLASSSSTGQGSGVWPGKAWRAQSDWILKIRKRISGHLSMATYHDTAGRERPMLGANIGHLTHLKTNLKRKEKLCFLHQNPNCCFTSSATSLLTHSSSGSPGSINPAMQEYIPAQKNYMIHLQCPAFDVVDIEVGEGGYRGGSEAV